MDRKWLIAAIIASGLSYLIALGFDSTLFSWVLKPGTMFLIIWYAVTEASSQTKYKFLIIVGLLFSVTGDTFLLMKGNLWFMAGLFSFLIAHLVYIVAFLGKPKFSRKHFVAIVPIAIYACLFLTRLHSGIFSFNGKGYESMWVPVVSYVVVISSMLWSTFISGNKFAAFGAILFLMSDSLLAWNMFVTPMPWLGSYGVMITYYSAQFLIAKSISGSRKTLQTHF